MRHLRALPFIAILAIILFAGFAPEPTPQVFDQQDKMHHLLGFAALAFTLELAFPRAHCIWLIIISLATALFIELGQSHLPHRTASMGDMAANTLGVLLGHACWLLLAMVPEKTHRT